MIAFFRLFSITYLYYFFIKVDGIFGWCNTHKAKHAVFVFLAAFSAIFDNSFNIVFPPLNYI